jgi:beta-1,4-mannosyl-glycoprotein beta-1,4-N-acetylglucosaminyltransferase
MKIWDCFMFFNEVDLLELRLAVLADYVDFFLIVESDTTHLGDHKEYVLDKPEYATVLKPYKDKIIYHKTTLTAGHGWPNENQHRLQIQDTLNFAAAGDDIIMVSDLDEIPNPAKFETAITMCDMQPAFFQQMHFVYWLNCWSGKVHPGSYAIKWDGLVKARNLDQRIVQTWRWQRDFGTFVYDGGWHYSYMGGADQIKRKAEAIAEGQSPNWQTSSERFQKDMDKAITQNFCPYSEYPLKFFSRSDLINGTQHASFHCRQQHDWNPMSDTLTIVPPGLDLIRWQDMLCKERAW